MGNLVSMPATGRGPEPRRGRVRLWILQYGRRGWLQRQRRAPSGLVKVLDPEALNLLLRPLAQSLYLFSAASSSSSLITRRARRPGDAPGRSSDPLRQLELVAHAGQGAGAPSHMYLDALAALAAPPSR